VLHAQAASDAAHGHNVRYLDLIAEAYNQAGQAQQAVELERQALALLPDPADRVDYERNLKRFQAALRRPAGTGKIELLPSLGYKGLRKQSPAISVDANLPEAGQRVVRLYTAWAKPDQAGEWRRKLSFVTN